MNIPILLIAYKKEDSTRKVIEHLRKIRAQQLYIVFNAPDSKKHNDNLKCERTRELVKLIDFDCNLTILNRKKHLNVSSSYIESINWFFEHVEDGIILDDDCIPDESFYPFAKYMLDKYRDNLNVMHINGSCFLPNMVEIKSSYFFSKFPSCWGWATWKRAWQMANFDELYKLKDEEYISVLKNVTTNKFIVNQLYWHLNSHRNWLYSTADAPDWRWTFAIWYNNGISISPSHNLIDNIGIGNKEGISTGKTVKEIDFASRIVIPLTFPLQHPEKIVVSHNLDYEIGKKYFPISRFRRWRFRLKRFFGGKANGIRI